MINDNEKQRDLAWFRCRLGCVTGSKIGDLMKSGKKKEQVFGDTALSYIYQVAAERMLNPVFVDDDELFADYVEQMQITSKAIRWGQEQEDNAKELLLRLNDTWKLSEVSSCRHDTIAHFAASPDGIIEDDCGIRMVLEIKCPNPNTYVRYLNEISDGETLKAVKPEYYYQMQSEMSCTGAGSGVFVAYCPWLTSPIHVVHIVRDEETIKAIEERVIKANEIVDEIIKATEK